MESASLIMSWIVDLNYLECQITLNVENISLLITEYNQITSLQKAAQFCKLKILLLKNLRKLDSQKNQSL